MGYMYFETKVKTLRTPRMILIFVIITDYMFVCVGRILRGRSPFGFLTNRDVLFENSLNHTNNMNIYDLNATA